MAEQVGLLCGVKKWQNRWACCVSVEVAEQVGLLCECRSGRTGGLVVWSEEVAEQVGLLCASVLGMCDVCAWVCSFHDVWVWSIYAACGCGSLWVVGVVPLGCVGVGVIPYGVWVCSL